MFNNSLMISAGEAVHDPINGAWMNTFIHSPEGQVLAFSKNKNMLVTSNNTRTSFNIYDVDGNIVTFKQTISHSFTSPNTLWLSADISEDGGVLVLGVYDSVDYDYGGIEIYDLVGGIYTLTQTYANPSALHHMFGYRVSMSADGLSVSVFSLGLNGKHYVYVDDGGWSLNQTITSTDWGYSHMSKDGLTLHLHTDSEFEKYSRALTTDTFTSTWSIPPPFNNTGFVMSNYDGSGVYLFNNAGGSPYNHAKYDMNGNYLYITPLACYMNYDLNVVYNIREDGPSKVLQRERPDFSGNSDTLIDLNASTETENIADTNGSSSLGIIDNILIAVDITGGNPNLAVFKQTSYI